MKIKLAPYAENICESGISCLLTMVQGNMLALTLAHWLVASQTAAKLRQPWIVSLVLGAVTTAVDAFVHRATFGFVSLAEAVVTGVGAFVLSLAVNWTLRRSRSGGPI
jgi:hypothetical protein